MAVNVSERFEGVSRGYATWKSAQRDRWNALPERTRMIATGAIQALVAIAFAVLIAVLVFRPTGILGERVSERV